MNKSKAMNIILAGLLCATAVLAVVNHGNAADAPEQSSVSAVVTSSTTSEYLEIKPVDAIPLSYTEEKESYFELNDYERSVLEKIVSGEARGESLKGQMLVAQCILNACLIDGLQPSEVRKVYKYGGWCETVSETTKEAVSKVFDDGEFAVDAPILYFYNPRWGRSSFHESQRFIIQEGSHKFFARW